ncbi:uncharacterized protein LOC112598218 isoform X1 [Melanaphis sacchari]|uniref:uncharacterized protein LOC112598218 isoform X1 n=1 Tax=Melanaphis sacchari TaxID=742174 RepID=UPI000DC1346A|nr:uncharacterized protein LOC112598218 isoform X1 [Melanaphis sacchari]
MRNRKPRRKNIAFNIMICIIVNVHCRRSRVCLYKHIITWHSSLRRGRTTRTTRSEGLTQVRSMHYIPYPQQNTFIDTTVMEPRTGYFCNNGIWIESKKVRQRRRHKEFVHRVQKKFCKQILNSIKMRLRIKKFNIDNPCND